MARYGERDGDVTSTTTDSTKKRSRQSKRTFISPLELNNGVPSHQVNVLIVKALCDTALGKIKHLYDPLELERMLKKQN